MNNINVEQRSSMTETLTPLAFHNIYKCIYDLDQLDIPPETNLLGHIRVKNAYQYAIDYLENKYYPDLEIDLYGDEYYEFEDPNTQLGVANSFGDKVGMTLRSINNYAIWPAEDSLRKLDGWKDAVTFNEFSLFTRMASCTRRQVFKEMPLLEEIDISHMTQVGQEFLWKCPNLRKIGATEDNVLPNLQHIGDYAFNWNPGLTKISIPNFGDSNFPCCLYECRNLEYAHIDGRYMTTINGSAFKNDESLKEVTGFSHVTRYGSEAFHNCKSLTHIDNLANMTYVETCVFENCYLLEGLDLSNLQSIAGSWSFARTPITEANLVSLTRWDYGATFYECTQLATVNMNPNWENYRIPGSSFRGCISLTRFDLSKCKQLDDNVFYGCTSLSDLVDTSNISRITGDYCFFGSGPIELFDCTSLTNIPSNTFNNSGIKRLSNTEGITTINGGAFAYSQLKSGAVFPNLVSLGNQAFRNCTKLTSLDIGLVDKVNVNNQQESFRDCTSLITFTGNELTYLGNSDFINCSSLTTVIIPKVETINHLCFYGCSSLATINFPKVKTVGDSTFRWCSNLTNVTFPECTTIGTEAFREESSLANINMPLCTEIKARGFYGCSNLVSVSMPSLITLGDSAFDSCQNFIGEFNFPNAINIGSWAFSNCQSVKSITLGTLSLIKPGTFYCCYAVRTISFTASENLEIQYEAFRSCNMLTSLDLTNLKTLKGGNTFRECEFLTTVTSLENLDTIETYDYSHDASNMFYNCIRLTTAPISNKLKTLPAYFFEECRAMVNVGDTSGLETLGDMAFYNCGPSSLQGAENFSHVTTIGGRCFQGSGIGPNCNFSSLVECKKRGGNEYSHFAGCNQLVSINISSLNEIPSYCFQNCSNLETVTVSTNLTRINGYAFNGCSKLNNLVLPSTLTYIGDQAFSGCNSLKRLIIEATTPPETHGYALISMPSDLIVYVPSSAVNAYSNAPRWSSKNIQPITSL